MDNKSPKMTQSLMTHMILSTQKKAKK